MSTIMMSIVIIFVFITIFSIIAGRNIFRKNYQRSGRLGSRAYLILSTLGIIQIGVVLLAILFQLIYKVLYAAVTLLVTLDIIVIIFTIIFILFTYSSLSRKITENNFVPLSAPAHGNFSKYLQITLIFFGIIVMFFIFSVFGGKQVLIDLITKSAVVVGNETVVRMIPYSYEWQRHDAYRDMSEKHADTSICDNFDDIKSVEGCKLNVGRIKLEKFYQEKISSTKKEDFINCSELREFSTGPYQSDILDELREFSTSSYQANIFDETTCNQLSLIQESITKNDPLICDEILSPFGYPDVELEDNSLHNNAMEKHAACVVHFIGSPSWQQGCEKLHFGMGRYSHLAKCTDPSNKTVPMSAPYFWFQ